MLYCPCIIFVGLTNNWPYGKYGLLKPTTGCPKGWADNRWIDNAWISQSTMDSNPSNSRSEILHVAGYVGPSFVFRYFCVKTTATPGSTTWPKGTYTYTYLYFKVFLN
jgi:hypothetical protein